MEIKVDQFCSLATSPSWQAWLYHFDPEMYKSFIVKLQASRGCSQNRDIMTETLLDIQRRENGEEQLKAYISSNYPHMIVQTLPESPIVRSTPKVVHKSQSQDKVFAFYNPKLLTYPRRMIFNSNDGNLKKQITEFTLDKIKHDFIIVDDVGYVEYLNKEDIAIIGKIPQSNWQIAAYRLRTTKK